MIQKLASSSKGNCVIYHESIMVDCGVSYSIIKDYIKDIKLILLTHKHKDHINISTLKKIQYERPSVRIACCEWMVELLEGFKNIDVLEIGKLYDYGIFKVSPFKLYHDVHNCGYRIFKNDFKIFHATDSQHLQGITAKEYDLYAIEANYDEDSVYDIISEKEMNGQFAHERGSINSHLSEQQAVQFFTENKKETSQLIRLHE